jgi:hypothetical protein
MIPKKESNSIMAGVELRGPEIGEFTVAGNRSGVLYSALTLCDEGGEKIGIVAEEFHDAHHRQIGSGKTLVQGTYFCRCSFRLDQWDT